LQALKQQFLSWKTDRYRWPSLCDHIQRKLYSLVMHLGRKMEMLIGSCLCGKIGIEVPDDFDYMGNCHCSECRKFTGSDYSSVGGISSSKFAFTRGEEFVSIYSKSEETELAFCKCCGSSLFSRKITGGKHNIRLGILDSTPTHKPNFHIFVASKAPWFNINDDLKQFDKSPVK